MLTASQIKWAASHDWFVSDNGNGTVVVEDRAYHRDTNEVSVELSSWVGSFGALRDWAGY